MPILYNCRHSGDQYRITKFDSDMNPQGSYLVDEEACECPAGVRPTCRHRTMLPKFIARHHVGDEWFFDFDRGGWVQGEAHWAQEIVIHEATHLEDFRNAVANIVDEPAVADTQPPEGHQFLTSSTAVIEPVRPPSSTHMKRRF